jgi:hypothetical protein
LRYRNLTKCGVAIRGVAQELTKSWEVSGDAQSDGVGGSKLVHDGVVGFPSVCAGEG